MPSNKRRQRVETSPLPLYSNNMSSSVASSKRGSAASARRVLQGVGRPLRRVSRGLFSGNKHRRTNGSASPAPIDYGSLEDGDNSLSSDRAMTRGSVFSEPSIVSHHGSSNNVDSRPDEDRDWVVYGLEYILLRILVVLGAFCLGASYPQGLSLVWRCMEYVSVAWVTCMVIIVAPQVKQSFFVEQRLQLSVDEGEVIPLLPDDSVLDGTRQLIPMRGEPAELEKTGSMEETTVSTQQHVELEHLFVMDALNGERLTPNNPSNCYRIDNDLFEGYMLLMFRTSDADDPNGPLGTVENSLVSNYFSTKQRRFEFQYQLKLKRVPEGRIYFSCEVEEPVNMGMIQRAFVGASMSFVKKMNNGFHFALNTAPKTPDGRYEVPHISFTVEGSMDRLVVTKPGDVPPKLGQEIEEDSESLKRRKKGSYKVDWNTQDTYTFAMWSAYCDFLTYKVMLPGVRPWHVSNVTGDQNIYLKLYTIPPTVKSEKHYRCDMMTVVDLEISNTKKTVLGPCAASWVHKNARKRIEQEPLADIPEEEQPLVLQKSFSHDDDDEDFVEEEDQDWVTVAELGEGMYLRSGDSVVLKESVGDDDAGLDDGFGYLTMAGGFAVLQNQASSTIVIEKKRSRTRSKLIKSGDTVMIKLLTKGKNGAQTETKYLSVHRGWWLKWVSIAPTKNGYFTIYTHETEFDLKDGRPQLSAETQTSYLTLNGTFWLRHRRWSKYQVGISAEESPTYGGRVLGLFRRDSSSVSEENVPNPEDDEDVADMQEENVVGKAKSKWMKPLYLVSQEVASTTATTLAIKPAKSPRTSSASFDEPSDTFIESIDVPAWVEMMHRTDRRPGLNYVVRVMEERTSEGNDEGPAEATIRCYLRTGRNVAEVIRAFQSREVAREMKNTSMDATTTPKDRRRASAVDRDVKLPESLTRSVSTEADSVIRTTDNEPVDTAVSREEPTDNGHNLNPGSEEFKRSTSGEVDFEDIGATEVDGVAGIVNVPLQENESIELSLEFPSLERQTSLDGSIGDQEEHSDPNDTDDALGSENESLESLDEFTAEEYDEIDPESGVNQDTLMPLSDSPTRSSKKGRKKFMGKIAKSMKAGTSATGKQVVKQGKKVGKGTVTAGKAIMSPIARGGVRPKKPPVGEPKPKVKSTKKRASRRRKAREHHVAVRKAVKSIGRKRNRKWLSQPPSVVAGQLCAPDQSCRTASHVLSKITTLRQSSPSTNKFNKILTRQLASPSDLDRWFLQGGAIELGVVPPKNNLMHESLVARCLWESHWREEWCGIYPNGVTFFAPLTKKPSIDLSFVDVQSVRRIDPSHGMSPLPGFPILAIDTAWRCHYIAFSGEENRDTFWQKITEAVFLSSNDGDKDKSKSKTSREKDLWKARFWQGFQNSVESSLSGGMGKWAKISSSSKMMNRTILNSRRMVFDIDPLSGTEENDGDEMKAIGRFVEDLLAKSLTFSLESLEEDPDSFVHFLDSTSQLRSLPLEKIDLASEEGFCIFANIYHCLLQHALLLSVNGPCTKRSVGHFMRCTCYEIGGDVFSLAELNCCVLRGKMSRLISPKAPYVDAPKKSSNYRFYAVDYVDPRINFLLNSADCACPRAVPVLTPDTLEEEMRLSSITFVQSQVSIDVQKKQILLPKVCDVYRNDFGHGEARNCLMYCLRYLTAVDQDHVLQLVGDDHLVVKYQPSCDQFHLFLARREGRNDNNVSTEQEESLSPKERKIPNSSHLI